MRQFLTGILTKAYNKIKSNPYFSSLYYSVANSNYFNSFLEHEKMISDKNRMDYYHRAITKIVKEGDIVIDLGTGTGILSFFAAKKSPKKIYAIDHGRIIDSAKIIAGHNQIKNIDFVNINSKNFNIISGEKADIIIHEQIGALLFDEHMNENIFDLRNRLLKKGGRILPGKFEVFIEPVKLKDGDNVPYIWEQNIYGIKYDCYKSQKEKVESRYGILKVRPNSIDYFLTEPERVLFFDLETMNSEDIPRQIKYQKKIIKAGRMDGFCFYFNIIFDEEIILSTNPVVTSTHWNVPVLRTESKILKTGDKVKLDFEWNDPADVNSYKWNIDSGDV